MRHMLRLKQHGLLIPLFNFDNDTLILFSRVTSLLVEPIQRTHSQRAIGVVSIHVAYASLADSRASFMSFGTIGSGQSFDESIVTIMVSPTFALIDLIITSSILNQ